MSEQNNTNIEEANRRFNECIKGIEQDLGLQFKIEQPRAVWVPTENQADNADGDNAPS